MCVCVCVCVYVCVFVCVCVRACARASTTAYNKDDDDYDEHAVSINNRCVSCDSDDQLNIKRARNKLSIISKVM